MSDSDFHLNPSLDVDRLARHYARRRGVRIEGLMRHDDAVRLRDALAGRHDWRLVVNSGDKVFELDRPTRAAMSAEQVAALDAAVAMGVRTGFQYRYESIRVPDAKGARIASADILARLARWLSGDEVLTLLRQVCGASDIVFADAQGTAYAPGDLLTAHDDAVEGKDRRAAYVLGLTPQWRPEWGGVLMFHRDGGGIEGRVPAFNTLDLFAVPQAHSVSQVTQAAPFRRYSVTGWLRAQSQPA